MKAIKQWLLGLALRDGVSVCSLVALFGRRLRGARTLRVFPGLVVMLIAVGLVTAPALVAVPAQARFTQQDKLVGSDAVGQAFQGQSVALSADGNTALVGGFNYNSGTGAVWVFNRNGNQWQQEDDKLVGSDAVGAAEQGNSVALSADGNTALVGGPQDNGGAGAVWVFTRAGGVWTQQGNKLVGTGALGAARQGWSVSLSADGNTALVGGPADISGIGAAWIFTRSGNRWTQVGNKLLGTGLFGAQQGFSVALSGDGNTALVGGPLENNGFGAAWVFIRRPRGAWVQQGDKLVGSGATGLFQPGQGWSVSLSANGNTALVGGPSDGNGVGATWAFTRARGAWTQQGDKLVGAGTVGARSDQGSSVALSADGNTALVGGPLDNNDFGAAWVFTRASGVWTQQGQKLVGSGALGPEIAQGFSVALSTDATTAIVGGNNDDGFAGAAWVFGQPGITAIHPNTGSVDGGTAVTIIGTNLIDVTGVLFGGMAATNVIEADPNTVHATTPVHAAGTVGVVVTTQTGNARAGRAYTYERSATATTLTSSPNPSSVGQDVTFTASVTAGGLPASGSVMFMNGTQTLGTVDLRRGAARLSTADLPAGVHAVKAFYLRNGNFDGSNDGVRHRVR